MDQSTDIGAINSSVPSSNIGLYAALAAVLVVVLIIIWYYFYRSSAMVNQPLKNLQHTYVANAVL